MYDNKRRFVWNFLVVALVCVLIGTGVKFRQLRQVELNRQLQNAIDAGQENRMVYLLQRGAELRHCATNPNWPLLFDALNADDTRLLQALLDAGDNPNVRVPGSLAESVSEGVTPLLWFVSEDEEAPYHLEKIKLLLEAGADPNARDAAGSSVLQQSAGGDDQQGVRWANPGSVAFLLQHGAKLSRGDASSLMKTAVRVLMTTKTSGKPSRGERLRQMCSKLPLSAKEKNEMVRVGLRELNSFASSSRRSQLLSLLRREVRPVENGPQ